MSKNYGLTDYQINGIIEEKLQARTTVLDEREKNIALKSQEVDARLQEYSEEKNLFDADKANFEKIKIDYNRVSEEELIKLKIAQDEVNKRQEELNEKEIHINQIEEELKAKDVFIESKYSEIEARENKINASILDIEDREVSVNLLMRQSDELKSSLAKQEQDLAVRLDQAIVIENQNKDKQNNLEVREFELKKSVEELEKQKKIFFTEQTAISNDNQVKAKLLDEQTKSFQAAKANLDKQREELALLKSETLKNQ